MLTGSKATLVDPGENVQTLLLELVDECLKVTNLVLETFDLIREGSDGFIECSSQEIWCRRMLDLSALRS